MIEDINALLIVKKSLDAKGVLLLSDYTPANTNEELYLKVREKENRLLPDELVKNLPFIPKNIPHYHEWELRKKTVEQFCADLTQQNQPCQILDLGCGNGWFSAIVASISRTKVVGLDLNLPELEQAQRVFEKNNLLFCYGNIFDNLFKSNSFDRIILCASIQYFPSINKLFSIFFNILKPNGEIHILDSPFYKIDQVENARKRTEAYYTSKGYPEMSKYYFHHTFEDLNPFSPILKVKKYTLIDKLLRKPTNPFIWVVIRKGLQ